MWAGGVLNKQQHAAFLLSVFLHLVIFRRDILKISDPCDLCYSISDRSPKKQVHCDYEASVFEPQYRPSYSLGTPALVCNPIRVTGVFYIPSSRVATEMQRCRFVISIQIITNTFPCYALRHISLTNNKYEK